MTPMSPFPEGMDQAEKDVTIDEHAWRQTNALHEHLQFTHAEATKELEELRTQRDQTNETFARHESALMERLAVCDAGLRANEPKGIPNAGSASHSQVAYPSPVSA